MAARVPPRAMPRFAGLGTLLHARACRSASGASIESIHSPLDRLGGAEKERRCVSSPPGERRTKSSDEFCGETQGLHVDRGANARGA